MPALALAEPRQIVIEIDPRADLLIDARATRRLTLLELSDVEVPPAQNGRRGPPALFLRVLGSEGGVLRIELWERGEFCGARRLSVAQASSQLGARRVALAAAELARQLRRKRLVDIDAAERERDKREREAARAAARTLDGPRALRTEAAGFWLPADSLAVLGPRLGFELNLRSRLRLDLGAEWLFGAAAAEDARVSALGIVLGPAQRFVLGRRLDLDVGLEIGVSSLHVSPLYSLDGIEGQSDTWTARAGAAVRLQPRLARELRLSLGVGGGALLRRIPVEVERGVRDSWGGVWLGATLGVVLTPSG